MSKIFKRLLCLSLIVLTSYFIRPFVALADELKVGSGTAQVELNPAGDFSVNLGKLQGEVEKISDSSFRSNKIIAQVSQFTTGIDLRDKHLREKFTSSEVIISDAGTIDEENGKAFILINGIRRPIEFSYELIANQSLIKIKFVLSLEEFKMTDMNYKGIGVEDEVSIEALLKVK